MPAVTLSPTDLAPFAAIDDEKAEALIEDALARAARVAPCIRLTALSADHALAARGIIRDAVLRKNDAGTGAVQQQTAGPFGQTLDTREPRRALFWPSEIAELQAICAEHNGTAVSTRAGEIDTMPPGAMGSAIL